MEKLWFLNNTMAIGTIMKCRHSSLTNMQNMQHTRNSSIQDRKWYLIHNDGTKLLKSCRRKLKLRIQKMEQCARINRMCSILITKNWQVITKVLKIIPIFWNYLLERKRGSIYLFISIKNVTMPLKHFKVRRLLMFPSTCEMWMLKEMEFIDYLWKKYKMKMMIFSHNTMSQILQIEM